MDKEHIAIERIKLASEMSLRHYGKPLVCTYSGGKDSEVMLELFKRSGIPFEVHNSHTTADAPQTVRHIRETFRELGEKGIKCEIQMPTYKGKPITMWKLIPYKKFPPTRLARYCCAILKETGCANRYIATGVRWDESNKRKSRGEFEKLARRTEGREHFSQTMLMNDNTAYRRMNELCMQKNKMVVNPIIDWKEAEIWDYIDSEHIQTCVLYRCGYSRVGCIGCPMSGKKRWKEFADFPKYKEAYIRAFRRMLEAIRAAGKEIRWRNSEEVFRWWMEDDGVPGQIEMDFEEELHAGIRENSGKNK